MYRFENTMYVIAVISLIALLNIYHTTSIKISKANVNTILDDLSYIMMLLILHGVIVLYSLDSTINVINSMFIFIIFTIILWIIISLVFFKLKIDEFDNITYEKTIYYEMFSPLLVISSIVITYTYFKNPNYVFMNIPFEFVSYITIVFLPILVCFMSLNEIKSKDPIRRHTLITDDV